MRLVCELIRCPSVRLTCLRLFNDRGLNMLPIRNNVTVLTPSTLDEASLLNDYQEQI